MATFVLSDPIRELWVEDFAIDAEAMGMASSARFAVSKRRLRGGRRDGVDLVQVDNGRMSFSIIPTRGMGLWRASLDGMRVGWDSPIVDGPVNPAYVNLAAMGGLGWLEGFDELLARCGLTHNGAPYEITSDNPDGSHRHVVHGLHGKIANIPAGYVAVHIGDEPPNEITIEGHVDEAHLFGPRIRMITRVSTMPGSNRLVVRDEFVNLKDQPIEMQVLYHWNFGPPFMEEGARFVAPTRTTVPRDARAVEGLENHAVYSGPEPGSTEQVYFHELHSEVGRGGATLAMLRNRAGDKAVVLRFETDRLPCFTLWKNSAGLRDGYVTGLEPGTNYPNPLPFEKARGRVVNLPVDGRFAVETALEVLVGAKEVAAVEAEVARIQGQESPRILPRPCEPFAAAP